LKKGLEEAEIEEEGEERPREESTAVAEPGPVESKTENGEAAKQESEKSVE
jgi:hypothetical protein